MRTEWSTHLGTFIITVLLDLHSSYYQSEITNVMFIENWFGYIFIKRINIGYGCFCKNLGSIWCRQSNFLKINCEKDNHLNLEWGTNTLWLQYSWSVHKTKNDQKLESMS